MLCQLYIRKCDSIFGNQNTMKKMQQFKYIFLILGVMLSGGILSQVVVKDTSYTVYQTYMKLNKNYPAIRIADPVKNAGIIATEEVVYIPRCAYQ